jgi:hypothetical protein
MGEPKVVTRSGDGYVLHLGKDERALVARLVDELRAVMTEPDAQAAASRLFPVVHPDRPDDEAEYQRLMRDELVTSRLAGIDTVEEVLGRSGRKVPLDAAEMLAFVQAVNSVRLVLGTVLDVGEDDEGLSDEADDSPEYHLYAYLSWVLDASVRAMSGNLPT